MTAVNRVNVTELRQNLPRYLARVRRGASLDVTSRGIVIARLVRADEEDGRARAELERFRARCRIGDVESPIDERWDADRPRSKHARR